MACPEDDHRPVERAFSMALIGEIAAAGGANGDWVELGPGFSWIEEIDLVKDALGVDVVGEAALDVDGPGETALDVDGLGEPDLCDDGRGEAGLGVSGLGEACLEVDGWFSSLTVLFGDLNSPDDSLEDEKLL